MGKIKDLKGKKFNKLTVIEFSHILNNRAYWKCKCECGNTVIVDGCKLRSSHTKSCGCLNKEKLSNFKKTHGDSKTRFYNIWSGINARCYRKTSQHYNDYGGRGIKCEWNKYEEFKNDMYESYIQHVNEYGENETTIDRINVNGNYCKENCKWATRKEQTKNTRCNISIVNGEILNETLERISKETNLSINTLRSRYYLLKKYGLEQNEYNIINFNSIKKPIKK